MTRNTLRLAAALFVALAAVASGSAFASKHVSAVTIKVADKGTSYVINRSASDTMYFAPATTKVKSGSTITFEYGGKPQDEPHTITVVGAGQLPRTAPQIDNCGVCLRLAAGHLANPKAPPGPTNDIAHWVLNKGKPGLDEVGDSVAIEGAKHRSISFKVTAPAGTTLSFICAVHPWMQAKLVVT